MDFVETIVEVTMSRGTIKWFNDAKGYGFIADDRGDVFVHYSMIVGEGFRSLLEGEPVEFEEQQGPKGRFATRVIRTSALHAAS